MKMYRAVAKEGFNPNLIFGPQASRRIPSNIPYLVDNLWEWLRPGSAPSRRHAVYASPTPELALVNASAVGSDASRYVVCEVDLRGPPPKLAHLNVKDARDHQDVGRLMRHVASALGRDFGSLSLDEKLVFAPLYLPGVTKFELAKYFERAPETKALSEELRSMSTFWGDVSSAPQEHDGELFFELLPGASYQLKPL